MMWEDQVRRGFGAFKQEPWEPEGETTSCPSEKQAFHAEVAHQLSFEAVALFIVVTGDGKKEGFPHAGPRRYEAAKPGSASSRTSPTRKGMAR